MRSHSILEAIHNYVKTYNDYDRGLKIFKNYKNEFITIYNAYNFFEQHNAELPISVLAAQAVFNDLVKMYNEYSEMIEAYRDSGPFTHFVNYVNATKQNVDYYMRTINDKNDALKIYKEAYTCVEKYACNIVQQYDAEDNESIQKYNNMIDDALKEMNTHTFIYLNWGDVK